MSRLKRKQRPLEVLGLKNSGNILDLFDNDFKQLFYLTDEEYDLIAEQCSEEELEILALPGKVTYSDMKEALNIIDKYIA